MTYFRSRKIRATAVAAACLSVFGMSAKPLSDGRGDATPATAPNVTYTAFGTFGTTPISGSDLFRLAGQPFSISIVASEALVSKNHGAQWAVYSGLKMSGEVETALLPTPVTISNSSTNLALAFGNPSYDVFLLGTPVKIVGMTVTITANITMPKGTIANDHILPFTAPVSLSAANATVTYSDTTESTTLAIDSGTLSTAAKPAAAAARVVLHTAGAQAIAGHRDGTQSVRPISTGWVDLGAPEDVVALQFYASGVRDASEVRVQIAGMDVPVLFAGAAGHFPGLDQVSVQLPRSLAGIGDVEVVLKVNGQIASPVHIHIQ